MKTLEEALQKIGFKKPVKKKENKSIDGGDFDDDYEEHIKAESRQGRYV